MVRTRRTCLNHIVPGFPDGPYRRYTYVVLSVRRSAAVGRDLAQKSYSTIRFKCPHCGKRIGTRIEHQGRSAKCGKCGGHLRIPTLTGDGAEALASPGADGDAKRCRDIHCPECKVHLALTTRQRRQPMLRCGKCGAEFLNMFGEGGQTTPRPVTTAEQPPPQPKPTPKPVLKPDTIEVWKGIFGKAPPPPTPAP